MSVEMRNIPSGLDILYSYCPKGPKDPFVDRYPDADAPCARNHRQNSKNKFVFIFICFVGFKADNQARSMQPVIPELLIITKKTQLRLLNKKSGQCKKGRPLTETLLKNLTDNILI